MKEIINFLASNSYIFYLISLTCFIIIIVLNSEKSQRQFCDFKTLRYFMKNNAKVGDIAYSKDNNTSCFKLKGGYLITIGKNVEFIDENKF